MRAALLFVAAALGLPCARTPAVEGVVLSNDAWPRAANLQQCTSDVIRISGLEQVSEAAQGQACFEWLRLFS